MLTVPQKARRGTRGEPPNPVEGVGDRPAILRDTSRLRLARPECYNPDLQEQSATKLPKQQSLQQGPCAVYAPCFSFNKQYNVQDQSH